MCSGASQASAHPVEHVASHEGGGLDVLNAKHLCQLEVLQEGSSPDVMSRKLETRAPPFCSCKSNQACRRRCYGISPQGVKHIEGYREAGSNMGLFADRQDSVMLDSYCCLAAGMVRAVRHLFCLKCPPAGPGCHSMPALLYSGASSRSAAQRR